VAAPPKALVYERSLAGIVCSNPTGGMGGCLVCVVFSQLVSASGWSLVQKNTTECGVVWYVCEGMYRRTGNLYILYIEAFMATKFNKICSGWHVSGGSNKSVCFSSQLRWRCQCLSACIIAAVTWLRKEARKFCKTCAEGYDAKWQRLYGCNPAIPAFLRPSLPGFNIR
jgi:hypothetical protein